MGSSYSELHDALEYVSREDKQAHILLTIAIDCIF